MKNELNQSEDILGNAYAIQELSECIKWLAELQIFQGGKESADIYNGDNACGSWYAAKITQTLADKIISEAEELTRTPNSEITK